jgi:BirA family biotin operon repressor/biotin-[acetyl-CoA-carboxylase] ligase
MPAFPVAYKFHFLAQVNSTNMYAMDRLYAGLADDGDVFFANFQLNGKGQRGKTWLSAPNESILMSVVLNTNKLTASQSFRLSAAIAVAAKDFLQKNINKEIYIKWPNDLYINDRKAGGILIENIMNNGVLKWSVIGIGINVNQLQFPEMLQHAVSLRILTGETYNCETLARELAGHIDERWQQLLNGGWQQILNDYNEGLYGRGKIKRLRKGSVIIPCLIQRVDSHGLLIAGENEEWHFAHGEVEWLLQAPESV